MKQPRMRPGQIQALVAMPFVQKLACDRLAKGKSVTITEFEHPLNRFLTTGVLSRVRVRKRGECGTDEIINGSDKSVLDGLLNRALVFRS